MSTPTKQQVEEQSNFAQAILRCGAEWRGRWIIFPDSMVYQVEETPGLWKISSQESELLIDKIETVTYIQLQLLKLHEQTLTLKLQ